MKPYVPARVDTKGIYLRRGYSTYFAFTDQVWLEDGCIRIGEHWVAEVYLTSFTGMMGDEFRTGTSFRRHYSAGKDTTPYVFKLDERTWFQELSDQPAWCNKTLEECKQEYESALVKWDQKQYDNAWYRCFWRWLNKK